MNLFLKPIFEIKKLPIFIYPSLSSIPTYDNFEMFHNESDSNVTQVSRIQPLWNLRCATCSK